MEVILLEAVTHLGSLGDKVRVKPGYARNYLVPHHKAVFATAANLAKFEAHRAELAAQEATKLAHAQALAEKLNALRLSLTAAVSEEGKLFGSLGSRELADAIIAAGVEVERSQIALPDGPIRFIGEYEIHVHLHPSVAAVVHVEVLSDA
jgi:large subunit ribosomal protein L9